jgi:WD40 repeat-containing protein SMU1
MALSKCGRATPTPPSFSIVIDHSVPALACAPLTYPHPLSTWLKVWNAKTTECTGTFGLSVGDITVHTLLLWPRNVEQVIVGNQSGTLYIINMKGQVAKSFTNGKEEGGDFTSVSASPRGDWVYAVAEDKQMYCFNATDGTIGGKLPVHDRDVIGVAHHPHQNLVATFAVDGQMKLWKP